MNTCNDTTLFANVSEATAVAVDALANLHNNTDHISRKMAIRAATERRAAFWSSSQYHDQKARNLLDEANDRGATAAIALRISSCGTEGAANNPHRLINTLVPLNKLAEEDIERARRAYCNAFANVRSF